MRILVTGGSGFIGSNFVHHLFHTHAGADASSCCPDHARYETLGDLPDLKVLNVDKLTYAADSANLAGVDKLPGYKFARLDICDSGALDKAIAQFEPEAIVHFAAESHVDRSIESGDIFVRTNVLGTQTLLDAARRHDVARFLHVSTDEVYGSIREGSFDETAPFNTASPYSASKAGSDLLVLAHHHTYGLPVQITRCTNNYGPRQHPEKLLPKVVTLAMRDQKLPIYGDGMNVRDWLYVKDHCTGISRVLQESKWGEVYNVGAQDERPNLDVVRRVLKTLGKSEELITFVTDRPGHDWRYSLNDTKLRNLGWAPRTTFEEGLPDAIRWVKHKESLS